MSGPTGEVVAVLRRSFDFYLGYLCATVIAAVLVIMLIRAEPDSFVPELVGITVFGSAAWLVWLSTCHPKVIVRTTGLHVVNWFHAYWIPWGAVASITTQDLLIIHLTDGRSVRPASGGHMLAGILRGNRGLRSMKDVMDRARQQPCDESDVVKFRTWDLHPIPFLAGGLALVVFSWLTR